MKHNAEYAFDRIRAMFLNAEIVLPLEADRQFPARETQKSQEAHASFGLSDEEIDAYEERAAIIEYLADLDRRSAEVRALTAILAVRRRIMD